MSTLPRLLVIGNGMTRQAFCRWLTDDPCPYEVVVFGEEPRPAYDRVHLSEYFQNQQAEHLELASRSWYEQRKIDLRTGVLVDSIDRKKRQVTLSDGSIESYDKLVLATGSRPFVPNIPGVDLDGVFVYRTIEDVEAIGDWAAGKHKAVVMGGGLLGLEAAKCLQDMRLSVHVVEMAPSLMPRQIDRECSDSLQRQIEQQHVEIHMPRRTESIERHGDFLVLRFDTGDSLAVEMVVISAGIRPRDELACDAGLEVGPRGGILINDHLQTSDPNIFAIGECACHQETVYGLVAPCYQMARALAQRLHGDPQAAFQEGDRSASLKLLGIDVLAVGQPLGESPETEVITGGGDDPDSVRKLLVANGRIVGAVGVGPWAEIEQIRGAINEGEKVGWRAIKRFRDTGSISDAPVDVTQWPEAATVCSCMSVTRGELTLACEQGCATMEAIEQATGAGTMCGSCRPLLARMVGQAGEIVGNLAGSRGLLVASCAVVVLLAWMLISGPFAFATSVTSERRSLDVLWRDAFWKQATGYGLMAVTIFATALSLRKRWKISFGAFGNWRMAHGILGALAMVGVVVHTGMHWGNNLNFWLMTCFLGINLIGALTGAVAAVEGRLDGAWARHVRRWRPRFTLIHIFFFWPLPVLLAIHIFSAYFY